jgi:chorismate-pyruvate lyase
MLEPPLRPAAAPPATAGPPSRELLAPLDGFYRRAGRPLLAFEPRPEPGLPEPARSLLVHDRDMTRTLEQFHRGTIHLRVLSSRQAGADYWRESVLRLDGSGQPVEFGAIHIHLDRFQDPCRRLILEEQLPLGGILNSSGLPYSSRPAGYFRVIADAFMAGALDARAGEPLYGRRNTLRDAQGRPLAEIVEILPPVSG